MSELKHSIDLDLEDVVNTMNYPSVIKLMYVCMDRLEAIGDHVPVNPTEQNKKTESVFAAQYASSSAGDPDGWPMGATKPTVKKVGIFAKFLKWAPAFAPPELALIKLPTDLLVDLACNTSYMHKDAIAVMKTLRTHNGISLLDAKNITFWLAKCATSGAFFKD